MEKHTLAKLLQKRKQYEPLINKPIKPFLTRLTCKHCGKENYIAKCCKSKYCPLCNYKRAIKTLLLYKQTINDLETKYKTAFLTLTWKNTQYINRDKMREYRNDFTKKFLRNKIIKTIIKGGLYSFDFTISDKQGLNLHLHTISLLQKPKLTKNILKHIDKIKNKNQELAIREIQSYKRGYLPQLWTTQIWKSITKDSYITDIREITNVKNSILEVLKYIQSIEKILNATSRNKGQAKTIIEENRIMSRFGILYSKKLKKWDSKCNKCGSNQDEAWITYEDIFQSDESAGFYAVPDEWLPGSTNE